MSDAIMIVGTGLILLVVGVTLPLVLLARQGFGDSTFHGKKEQYNLAWMILDLTKFTLLFFFIYPSVGVLIFNYILLVVSKEITLKDFFQSLDIYSYLPILRFYADMGMQLRGFVFDWIKVLQVK